MKKCKRDDESRGHSEAVFKLAMNQSGTVMASASKDKSVRLWDMTKLQPLGALNYSGLVWFVAFNSDGTRLAAACADRSIRLWDVQRHEEITKLDGGSVACFSPDGARLACPVPELNIRILDTVNKMQVVQGSHSPTAQSAP